MPTSASWVRALNGGFHSHGGIWKTDGLFHGKSFENGWFGGSPILGDHSYQQQQQRWLVVSDSQKQYPHVSRCTKWYPLYTMIHTYVHSVWYTSHICAINIQQQYCPLIYTAKCMMSMNVYYHSIVPRASTQLYGLTRSRSWEGPECGALDSAAWGWCHRCNHRFKDMGVSINGGSPKWMVDKGNPIEMDDLGIPLF